MMMTDVAPPAWEYFDHDADTGVIGRGPALAQAFVHAAEATFALMCDLHAVQPRVPIDIEFAEAGPEFALVTWLNLLLAHANAGGLALSRFGPLPVFDPAVDAGPALSKRKARPSRRPSTSLWPDRNRGLTPI